MVLRNELNGAMHILQSWFSCNKLSLNTTKSKLMLFGTAGQLNLLEGISVEVPENTLELVSEYKYLGVVLDPQLNFSRHVEYLKRKTLGKIGLLGRIRNFVDHETSLMLFKTLILPLFDYCDVVYNCLSQKDQHTLQKLQNCALRNTVQCRKLTPTDEVHEICSMEYLITRCNMHVSNEMYKIDKGLSPLNVQSMFTKTMAVSERYTRSTANDMYYVPKCKLETGKRNFRYRGAKNWNYLPLALKQSPSLSVFKKNCYEYYVPNRAATQT